MGSRPALRLVVASGAWKPLATELAAPWLEFLGAQPGDLDEAFRRTWSLGGWQRELGGAAAKRERIAREFADSGDVRQAAEHGAAAALYAHLAPYLRPRRVAERARFLSWSARIYRELVATPANPSVRRVAIPWRDGDRLPGYLHVPPDVHRPPVVAVANAVGFYKETWTGFARHLAARGVATLAFDAPGEGEMWPRTSSPFRYAGVASNVLDHLRARPDVDGSRAGVVGVSFGGTLAALAAASDGRWAAVGAASPAYDATHYAAALPGPLLHALAESVRPRGARRPRTRRHAAGWIETVAPAYSLEGVARNIRAPLVVVQAGRDMLVPPEDAKRLFDAASSPTKRLIHLEGANHVGLPRIRDGVGAMLDFVADALAAPAPARGQASASASSSKA